ncbi:MAG: Sll0314/Alr1548 family TPR repeat-containing protein [Phormidesmis sp.]
MAFQTLHTMSSPHLSHSFLKLASIRPGSRALRKRVTRVGSALLAFSLSLGMALPTLAADPFRSSSSHEIGEHTEAAFEAIFKEGDYVSAREALVQAEETEPDEPLVHAMLASMAYLEGDAGLPEVKARAELTTEKAKALVDSDPLRGHLYTAVGIFLEGAYVLKTEGIAKGTPRALAMLQRVFSELDDAESIAPNDPELNLLKGYMDLMLAVNLPFSNPEEAIERMSSYGSPTYLTQRGIAIGYRDLEQYDDAMSAVDQALSAAPDNPELLYLKAQISNRLGNQAESAALFEEALTYSEQLPEGLVKRITWEGCVVEGTPHQECSELVGY